jgi:FAD:protein FMN transferase
MNRRRFIAISALAAAPLARAETIAPARISRPLMGTTFTVQCHADDHSKALPAIDEAFACAEAINAVASDYIADSELLELTRHPVGKEIPVSEILFPLLLQARGFAEKTDGHFDPTLGPLTRLWRESRRRGKLPQPEVLEAAQQSSGWRHFTLDPERRSAVFHRPNMRLDLGGIAKGQAADAMLATLAENGFTRVCIAAGGDVRVGDPPPGREGWRIAVTTFDPASVSRTLVLANAAVSTSGDLHQSIEIDGVRYSHIIDPATGLGMTRRRAATVIAENSTTSDALATACCVAPPETAKALGLQAGAREVFLGSAD